MYSADQYLSFWHSYPDTHTCENYVESGIGFCCFRSQRIRFFEDLPHQPIIVRLACVNVSAGRNIEVILLNLLAVDDARVPLHFLPSSERVGDATDSVLWNVVLRVALGEVATGVQQEEPILALLRLGLVMHDDDARRSRVVEEILRQVDDTFDQVLLDKPAADFFLFIRIRFAGATRSGTGVDNHGGAARWIKTCENMLQPTPISFAAGIARTLRKAIEFIGIVVLLLELRLIPHGISYNAVESPQAVTLTKLGLAERIPDLNLALQVVDDHVHICHRPRAWLDLLPLSRKGVLDLFD